ncbi:MAG: DUF2207 family protein [Acidimicrobiales bacterium]
MAYKGRRLLDKFLLVGGALATGMVGLVAAAGGDTERIDGYWTSAAVGADGEAQVTEVIDYEFGVSDRHGIFRDIPRLNPAADITVESPTAPDQFVVEGFGTNPRIRIGDPNATINGRHRYRIEYPIGVALDAVQDDARISWNAVGTAWPVAVRNIEIHIGVAAELSDVLCSQGEAGSWEPCSVSQPEPGHLVVELDKLNSFEGVTVTATPTRTLSAMPALPEPPSGAATDPGTGVLPPAATAAAIALLAAAAASIGVRRAGREYVWAGGSADAAFGPQFGDEYPVRLVDHDELNSLASTEFAPPRGISAWQGGVLYNEAVSKDQQVAWLLERAIAGEIEIEGEEDDLKLHLLDVDSSEPQALKAMFGGRKTVDLGKYDQQFAGGWDSLGKRLNRWHVDSEYWDPEGDRKRTRALATGIPLTLLGLVGLVLFSIFANRSGPGWLVGVGLSGLAVGAGFSLLLRRWELRIRTPEGSGLWILIESFRRFIHNSDAQHVDDAAKRGVLLDYTAWAVALGEVDRWSKAVKEAQLQGSSIAPQAFYMATMAPRLGGATSAATTAPSTSGSGGGGSVGGGGGGGGGGSW